MTNEEQLEEILYLAFSLGIEKELMKRIPSHLKYDERVTFYTERLKEIANEKGIEIDYN